MKSLRALFLTAVLAFGSVAAWATDFTAIYVMGDSLSDGGNAALAILDAAGPNPAAFQDDQFDLGTDTSLVPGAPYLLPDGAPDLADFLAARFTNGPVWVEQLAARLGLPLVASFAPGGGTNYAFGGARTGPLPFVTPSPVPTLRDQANLLLFDNGGALDPDALYVVFGGGNDLRDALLIGDAGQALSILHDSARNLRGILADLYAAGGRHFLVGLAPNLGLVPEVQLGGLSNEATAASVFLNILYAGEITRFRRRNSGTDVRVLNSFLLLTKYVTRPEPFGFTNTTDPCVSFYPPCTTFADPDEYVFWDGIHPTRRTHALVAKTAQRILERRRRVSPRR